MDQLEEFESQQGKYYNSIEDILHDMTQAEDVGLPWIYFIKVFENAFETYRISIDDSMPGIEKLKEINIGYYNAVISFANEVNTVFGNAIAPKLYNKLIALSLIMKRVGDFVTSPKCNKELKSFNDSIMFLQKAKKRGNQPNEFYTAMSVIFMWEDLKIKYEYKKKDRRDKQKAEDEVKIWMDVLRNFFLKKIIEIVKMVYRGSEIIPIEKKIKIEKKDVYYHIKGNKIVSSYPLDFFDDLGRAKTVILTGDKGSGKTIGSFSTIESAIEQKYAVVVFGEDTRKEFRWASFPMSSESKKTYDILLSQGRRPKGLPIKIFRKNPNPDYPIEHDVSNFKGTISEWNKMHGVYVFENDLRRIMEKFGDWRGKDKKKKVICVLNEAGEFVPVTASGEKWKFVEYVKFWFTHIRGWKVPVLMNTQWMKKLDKNARQADVIITSYLSNIDDRKLIAVTTGNDKKAYILGDQELKPNNYFVMFDRGKIAKIKFLMTRCMPESSTSKTLDELFAEKVKNSLGKERKEGVKNIFSD